MCAEPVCSLVLGLQRCQLRTDILSLCKVTTEMDKLMQQLGGQQVMAAICVWPAPSLQIRSLVQPHEAAMYCMHLAYMCLHTFHLRLSASAAEHFVNIHTLAKLFDVVLAYTYLLA